MSTAQPPIAFELDTFRHLSMMADRMVRRNVEGVTHAESLVQPQPAGNCLNWVVGHLVCVYTNVLPLLGQETPIPVEPVKRYDRGQPPITDPAEALPFDTLVTAWGQMVERMNAGLDSLTPERLDEPAPFSPSGSPNETIRSLVLTVFGHQIYHAGQLGVLRRIAGKPGAIK